MPSWISPNGIWKPAKERVYDEKKGEMYEGPDRAALEVLAERNIEHLGIEVKDDPQVFELARQRGLTVEQYLEMHKPMGKQQKEKELAQGKIVDHKDQPKKQGVRTRGGGVTISGGFGDMPA